MSSRNNRSIQFVKKKISKSRKKNKKGRIFRNHKSAGTRFSPPSPLEIPSSVCQSERDRTKSERRGAFHQHEIIIHDQCSGSRFASFIIGSRGADDLNETLARVVRGRPRGRYKVFLLLLLLSCWTREEILLLLLLLQCYCSAFTQS